MSIAFSGSELVEIAISVEKTGAAFYNALAKSTGNSAARTSFQHLADMEREHIRVFQGMLGAVASQEGRPEEYTYYLRALVDTAVFPNESAASEKASMIKSEGDAITLAVGAEKDSILFYYEMRDLLPVHEQALVDKVIAEEKSHLRYLAELSKKLAAR